VAIAARNVTPARRSGRFVGRDTELSLLRDEFAQACKGTPAFVAISAEAGSGKTRLVEEFRSRIATDATWLEGRAYPFAQNIPYYAITDLISNRLGIDEADSADTVRDPRGFAVKFYTEEGNWDLVGNNTPVFFLRDPLKFPDLNSSRICRKSC